MSEREPSHAVYVISVFAEIGGVHPQTLRNYERTGLLNPQRTSQQLLMRARVFCAKREHVC